MKKLALILGLLFCSLQVLFSQQKQVWMENFDNPSSISFTTSATASGAPWTITSGYSISSPNAYRGRTPNGIGDSVVLETQPYDFSNYSYPESHIVMKFKQICKISTDDEVRIYYKVPNQAWKPLESAWYDGNGNVGSPNVQFNAASYPEWKANDNNAVPLNSWWREELFDIGFITAGNNSVQFRFVIKKGNVTGSDFAYGWLIDDFEVIASPYRLDLPTVKFTSYAPEDTVYFAGSYTINAKVKTNTPAPIRVPNLSYTYIIPDSMPVTNSIVMTNVSGDSLWSAELPAFTLGTSVSYFIAGSDTNNNSVTIRGSYVIARYEGDGSFTGEAIVGTGTSTTTYAPIYTNVANATSRMLYLGSELNLRNDGGLITSVAWYSNSTITPSLTDQKCYMRAVDETELTTGVFTPVTDGASLVWEGTINGIAAGWVEIKLDKPFELPSGKNLLVYWLQEKGSASGAVNWRYTTSTNTVVYTSAATYLTAVGTRNSSRPNARFQIQEGYSDDNAVALVSFLSPKEGTLADQPEPIKVVLRNKGTKNLDSVTIYYSINGQVNSTTYHANTPLPWGMEDSVIIGTYIPTKNRYDEIIVWADMPNGVNDPKKHDDTIHMEMYGCRENNLAGDYIIGSSSSADFLTGNDLLIAIKNCGIGGDITAKFESGIHQGINLYKMESYLQNYSFTITSLANHKDSVIFSGSKLSVDTIMIIDSVSNIIIKDITIDATDDKYCIFLGKASNITICNNNIIADSIYISSSADRVPIYKPNVAGKVVDGLVIKNNLVIGGTYGIGILGAATNISKNILIDSNIILSQSSYVLYVTYCNQMSVSDNIITARVVNTSAFWRPHFANITSAKVTNNRISLNSKSYTSTIYGLYFSALDSLVCANNDIRMNSATTTYGIHTTGGKNVKFLHNSVLLIGSGTGSFRAFNSASVGTAYTLKNNIFIANGGESPYAVYIDAVTNLAASSIGYNTYYSSNSLAYVAREKERFKDWIAAVPSDTTSINVYPIFADTTKNLKLAEFTGFNCLLDSTVMDDMTGYPRLATTTMGAYTRPVVQVNPCLVEIIDWKESATVGDNSDAKVVLQNLGTDILTNVTINYKWNNNPDASFSKNVNLVYGEKDTIPISNFTYNLGINSLLVYVNNVSGDIALLDDTLQVSNYTCGGPINGTITVGTSGSYATIDEVIAVLENCGIDGPVVIEYETGTHYQNTEIESIPGVSVTNTITITSASGNYNDVIIYLKEKRDIRTAPFWIENVGYITLANLTLVGMDASNSESYSYSHGIIVGQNTHNIIINNCYIKSFENKYIPSENGKNMNGIYVYDGVSNLKIQDNIIEGGACGVYLIGLSNTERSKNILIDNNIISKADAYGIYTYWSDSVQIKRNTITQRQGSFDLLQMHGIYLYYMTGEVASNKINLQLMNAGIYTNNVGSSTYPVLISNNEIIGIAPGNTTNSGFYIGTVTVAKYYHNSVVVKENNDDLDLRGIFVVNNANTIFTFENNIITTQSSVASYPMFISGITSLPLASCQINNNCYYSQTGTYVGTVGAISTVANRKTLATWKQAVATDKNSVNVAPNFMNKSSNLNLLDTISLTCPLLSQVLTDINGSVRSSITNMGAYQFTKIFSNAALTEVITPEQMVQEGTSTDITVVIQNLGADTLKSLMIGYEINGAPAAQDFHWTGILAPNAISQPVTITNNDFIPVANTNTLKIYSYSPNNVADEDTSNDTINMTTFACGNLPLQAGTYTIGSGGAYKAINEAILALQCNGIAGPVVFSILPGTYSEEIVIEDTITGSSDINTITFISSTSQKDEVLIEGTQTIRLKNTAHIYFRHLSIYGGVVAVSLEESGTNIEFYDCNIQTNLLATKETYRAINCIGSTTTGKELYDIRFIKNDIIGGCYGMYISTTGQSGNNGLNMGMITIDSNNILEACTTAIYVESALLKSISDNTIVMREGATFTYGIRFYSSSTVSSSTVLEGIQRNSIKKANYYSLYLSALNQSSTYGAKGNVLVANNEVYGTNYGIYLNNSNADVYHNSVYVTEGGTSGLFGLYFNYPDMSYKANIKNNLFITSSTTGKKGYPIFASYIGSYTPYTCGTEPLSKCVVLDYNNYYDGTSNIVGGYSCAYGDNRDFQNIKSLQNIIGQDRNSVSVMPDFVNADNNLELQSSSSELICPRISIPEDITGAFRTGLTEMGAYITSPSSIDAALVGFVGFENIPANTPISVDVVIENSGTDPLTSAMGITIMGILNGNPFGPISYNPATPLQFGQTDVISLPALTFAEGNNSLMAAITTIIGDAIQMNDTIRTSGYKCSTLMGGEYIIGPSSASDFPTWETFVDSMPKCGVGADVILKYEAGTYNQVWNFVDLENMMGDYHLTITSLDNDRDSVVFVDLSGHSALVTFDNVKNVTLKNLTLNGLLNTNVVKFNTDRENKNIIITDCNLLSNDRTTTTADTLSVIYKPGKGKLNNIFIKNNTLSGNAYGIYLYGSNNSYITNILIDSNILTKHDYTPVAFTYVDNSVISNNMITSRSAATQGNNVFRGIYHYIGRNIQIAGNRIYVEPSTMMSGAKIGIYLSDYNSQTSDITIINNEVIIRMLTDHMPYGIYISSAGLQNITVLHNTVYMSYEGDGGAANIRACHVNIADKTNAVIKNNIFVTQGGDQPYPIYLQASSSTIYQDFISNFDIDNNALYSTGNIGYANAMAQPYLEDWQQVVPSDTRSRVEEPFFATGELRLENYQNFVTDRIDEVVIDIEGKQRNIKTLLGAYELDYFTLDATLMGFTNMILSPGQTPAQIILTNMGEDTLRSAIISWNINGIDINQMSWTGTLAVTESDTVNIGLVTIIPEFNMFKAWVSNPNGGMDMNQNNDTLIYRPYSCLASLAGDYIIGSSSNADFATMEDAVQVLTRCGVQAPVTMYFESDTFYQNVTITPITGSSEINTITFTSLTGNREDVLLQRADISAARIAPMMIDRASNIIFSNLSFSGYSSDGSSLSYAHGLIINKGKNIKVSNCSLIIPEYTSTTFNDRYIPLYLTDNVSKIKIDSNILSGGAYGIYLNATSNYHADNILIKENIIRDMRFRGIMLKYTDTVDVLNNIIHQQKNIPIDYSPAFYGLYFDNVFANTILNNTIKATALYYGIYTTTLNNKQEANPALIANNEIIAYGKSTNATGIYLSSNTKADVLHNSIVIVSDTTAKGIYVSNSNATTVTASIKNNNIALYSSKSSYPIHIYSNSYLANIGINSNNYYNANSPYVAAYGSTTIATVSTLKAWTSIVASDVNSVVVEPVFSDMNESLALSDFSGLVCLADSLIMKDIKGIVRDSLTIIGAYTLKLSNTPDLALQMIIEPINSVSMCAPYDVPVSYAVLNKGDMDWDFSNNPITLHLKVSGIDLPDFDTAVVLNSGHLNQLQTDTFNVMDFLDVSFAGVYNIQAWISSPIDTIYYNDTLYATYSSNKIALPFDETFDTSRVDVMKGLISEAKFGSEIKWEITQSDTVISPNTSDGKLIYMAPRGSMARLYTTQLELNRTSLPKLEFWYAHDNTNPDLEDIMYVKISCDGSENFTHLMSVERYDPNASTPYWGEYTVDLSHYIDSSCVIVAFEAMSYGGIQQIDRIAITSSQNLGLDTILVSAYSVCELQGKELKIVLSNTTNQRVDFTETPTDLVLSITGDITKDTTITLIRPIEGLKKDTITILSDFDFKPGTYYMKAYLSSSVRDFDKTDDTTDRVIIINPAISIQVNQISGGSSNCLAEESALYQTISITNTGNMDVSNIGLILQIDTGEAGDPLYLFLEETYTGVIAAGNTVPYTFINSYIVPWIAEYQVTVLAYLLCDSLTVNAADAVRECTDMVDLYMVSVDRPLPSAVDKAGEAINLEVTLRNRYDASDFNGVHINVLVENSLGEQKTSFYEICPKVALLSTVHYEFNNTYTVPNDTVYYLTVYVDSYDNYKKNDTIRMRRVTDYVNNIESIGGNVSISMDQNIPNPANNNTMIRYNIPESGDVTFRIHSINGQLLYNKTAQSEGGTNTIEINTSTLAAGIYMYSMEYKGQRVVKRMSIKR